MNIEGTIDRSKKGNRHVWSKAEEEPLLNVLDDVVAKGYRTKNGTFKTSSICVIKKPLATLCQILYLKVNPHIESKMKKWKQDYGIILDMLKKSDFGWNEMKKCVEIDSKKVRRPMCRFEKITSCKSKYVKVYVIILFLYSLYIIIV